jgi:hypothetical protein
MKKLIIMTTTLLVFVLIAFLIYITRPNDKFASDHSVLRDVTDVHLAQPNARDILNQFNLDGVDKWNGSRFRFQNLNDVSFNQPVIISIDPSNPLLSNVLTRETQLTSFTDSIKQILKTEENEKVGKEYSSLYIPIANELARLNKSNAEERVLSIYSDLMQNDLEISLYQADQLELIKTNPKVLKEKLIAEHELPDLKGITINLIYQPTDINEDADWKLVSKFYKSLFQEKGANVLIGASLTSLN